MSESIERRVAIRFTERFSTEHAAGRVADGLSVITMAARRLHGSVLTGSKVRKARAAGIRL